MKNLITATLAVFLLYGALQLACGKPQAPLQKIQSKLARAGDMLSVIAQAAQHKRSLVRPSRQIPAIGSCSSEDVTNLLDDYPSDCLNMLLNVNFDEFVSFSAIFDVIANFCNERCGQPIVDLSVACNATLESAFLVYSCSINENGDPCGSLLDDTFNAISPARTDCLPRATPCSNACQTSLQTLRDTVGCCVNMTELEANVDINNFTLWESCGVPVPGLCTERPINSGIPLMVTKVAFIGLAALALMVLLL